MVKSCDRSSAKGVSAEMNESRVYSTLPHCIGSMTSSYSNATSRNGLGLFLARPPILVTWFLTKERNLSFLILLIFSWDNLHFHCSPAEIFSNF